MARLIVLFLAFTVSISGGLPRAAAADTPLDDRLDRILWLDEELEARFGPDIAYDVMAEALAGTDVTEDHIESWADGLTQVYFQFDDPYENAARTLSLWQYAIWDGRYTEPEARRRVDAGLHNLRLAHYEVLASLPEYLRFVARAQEWRDRARHIARTMSISGAGCRPYYRALNLEARARARAGAAMPWHYARRRFVPLPEDDPGAGDLVRIISGHLPDEPVSPGELAAIYDGLILDLLADDVPEDDPLIAALRLARVQATTGRRDLSDMANGLAFAEPSERDLMGVEAAAALAQMVADLAPLLAAAEEADALPLETAYALVDVAQRLTQLYEDLERRGADATPLLRGLSGIRAALMLVRMPDSGEEATRLNQAIADLGRFASADIPPTAPIAIPASIAAGLIDVAGDGFVDSADTLAHLGRFLETGDFADYQRMLEAARRVQQTLHPRNFLRQALISGIEGVVSNVPGLRSLFGRHFEDMADWALDGGPYDWDASYDPSLLGPHGQGVCPRL
jgi:hypothetical protein